MSLFAAASLQCDLAGELADGSTHTNGVEWCEVLRAVPRLFPAAPPLVILGLADSSCTSALDT